MAGVQQQQQQHQQLQQQQQAPAKTRLISSIATILAQESVDVRATAAIAVSGLDADTCAGFVDLPEADKKAVLLQLAQQPGGPAPAEAGGAPSTAAAAAAGADAPTLPGDAADRVSRIELDGQTIGTVVRISEHGVCVAATHCLVDAGKFLEHASAFGGKLELIGSSPNYDIIFVKGEPGQAVQLSYQLLQVGQAVSLLGFPLAIDTDLGLKEHPISTPVVTRGQVAAMSWLGGLAAADYDGALPNASGDTVLSARSDLAGVHVGASYHLDSTHKPAEEEDAPPRQRWDTDPSAMWQGSSAGSHGKRRKQPQQPAAHDINNVALHAAANIPHKGQLALFVPAAVIGRLAQQHGLLQLSDDLAIVQQQHAAHCYSRA